MTKNEITNTLTINPGTLSAIIRACVLAMQPLMIWGKPGIGKSAIVAQAVEALNGEPLWLSRIKQEFGADTYGFIDIRALLLDPVDLRGLPSVSGGITRWNQPDFLPCDGAGILFLDELPAAPQMVQAALYQLVQDRKIGDYILPDGWVVIAAGNSEGDGAVSHRMPTPLRNKMVQVELASDSKEWLSWAMTNSILPEVIGYIAFAKDSALFQFDKSARSFATPRSWSYVSRMLAIGGLTPQAEHAIVEGLIGVGPAIEFLAFLRTYRDLPTVDSILLNPLGAPVPTSASALYAVCAAIGREITPANIATLGKYLGRIPVEYATIAIISAIKRDRANAETRTVNEWIIKNQFVLA